MWLYSPSTRGFYKPGREDIPTDVEEITDQLKDELFTAERQSKEIAPGPDGTPVAIDPPPLTGDDLIKRQIVVLEYQQTPRRIREAALGIDNGWLAEIEAQIQALRAQLEGA